MGLSLSHSLFVIVFWLARSSYTFISRLLWTEVLIGEEVVVVVASHQGVEPLHLVVDRHRRVPGHPHPDCVLVHLLTNLGESYILIDVPLGSTHLPFELSATSDSSGRP